MILIWMSAIIIHIFYYLCLFGNMKVLLHAKLTDDAVLLICIIPSIREIQAKASTRINV